MLCSLTLRVLSSGGMFIILLALFAVALVLVLAVVFVARLMLTVLPIVVAPLALACHALPQTGGIARWWLRAFAGLLLIQSAQALVLVAAARVFLTEQWVMLTGPRAGRSPCPAAGRPVPGLSRPWKRSVGLVPVRFDGELGARGDAEFAEDVYQMGLDGGVRDEELPGYLGVGKVPAD